MVKAKDDRCWKVGISRTEQLPTAKKGKDQRTAREKVREEEVIGLCAEVLLSRESRALDCKQHHSTFLKLNTTVPQPFGSTGRCQL